MSDETPPPPPEPSRARRAWDWTLDALAAVLDAAGDILEGMADDW